MKTQKMTRAELSETTARRAWKRIGIVRAAARTGPAKRIDWSGVDWSSSNLGLAMRYGVTEYWVRKMRKRETGE